MRTLIDGQWVAAHLPADSHGTLNGYRQWFCRCAPCIEENKRDRRARDERNGIRSRAALDQELAEELNYLVEEYQFMRSFGMDHHRACKYIGTDPTANQHYFYPIAELEERLRRMGNLIPIAHGSNDGPAMRFRFEGAPGEIGLIGSMSAHFCSTCNRIRLTAAGQLRPCLLSEDHVDVITPLRNGAPDSEIESLFSHALASKKREHQLTFSGDNSLSTKMVSIGG